MEKAYVEYKEGEQKRIILLTENKREWKCTRIDERGKKEKESCGGEIRIKHLFVCFPDCLFMFYIPKCIIGFIRNLL